MNTKQIKVGQEVAIRSGYGDGEYRFGLLVRKVTPTGQVVVGAAGDEKEFRFGPDGREMGKGFQSVYTATLEPDVAKARAETARKERLRAAREAVHAIKADPGSNSRYWDKVALCRELEQLEKLVAMARKAVEAI
jgi:hypothetical protein